MPAELADIDPALETVFSRFGAPAQSLLESLHWEEAQATPPKRTFIAKVHSQHMFWALFWRPNKITLLRKGFSVSKPGEDWLLTFVFTDPALAQAAQAQSHAVRAGGEVPAPPGLSYFEYQKAGIEFLASCSAALLADDPGLGKTIQVCGLLNLVPSISRVLVICPASVKYVWLRELNRWLLDKGRNVAIVKGPADLEADIAILNYEMLVKFREALKTRQADLLVLDEAHYIKNPKAWRTKACKELAPLAARKVLLTGTPIMNRPAELWSLLNLLDAKAWGPFFPFAKQYCNAFRGPFGWDFSGASNLEELNNRLRASGSFLRRRKADVLPQLPKVIRQVVPLAVDMSPILEELTEALAAELGVAPEQLPFDIDPTRIPFELTSAIRRETGNLKVEAALQFIREQTGDFSDKVVVFAHHQDILVRLAAALDSLGGAVKVTGSSSLPNRERAITDFQTDPAIKFFVASIQAMGVGVTLTAASRVIFVEQDWTPAMMEQAESRLHRIGQSNSVLSQYLVVRDSIDERIMGAIVSKMRIIAAAIEPRGEPATKEVVI